MSKANKSINSKKNPINDPEEYEDKSGEENSDMLSSDPEDAGLEEKSTQPQNDSSANQSILKKSSAPGLKVVFNVADTKYPIVKYVGKKLFKWKLSYDNEEEFDILWTDSAVQPDTLAKMQAFQKINHFPGTYSISRKNNLGRNLERMRRFFPDKYKFFPPTWILPAEWADFRSQFNKKMAKTFIVKPEASCQGRGIFLTRNFEDINPTEPLVAQRYIHKPFLIDGLKFDLRIYVLLAGCDPLRIFIYKEGLARFATEQYVAPKKDNMVEMCMHLTNYAINKNNPNFVFNEDKDKDDVGHKRSFTSILKYLENNDYNVDKLMREIKDLIIKTFCSVQPVLAHHYRGAQPENFHNNMCFEILGFDVMLDHKLKPWLIEVNHTPSFTVDTPFDKKVKKNVIHDTLKLMNINVKHKAKYKMAMKAEFQKRMQAGKKSRLSPEEKLEMHNKAQKERDIYEADNLGAFEKIYPLDENKEGYEEFLTYAHKMWSEYTGSNIRRVAKKSTTEIVKEKKPTPSANISKLIKSKVQVSLESGDKPKMVIPKPNNSSPSLKASSSFSALDQKKTYESANSIFNIREEEEEEVKPEKPTDRPLYLNNRSESQTPLPNISNVREDMYMEQDVLGEDEDREVVNEKDNKINARLNEYKIKPNQKKELNPIVQQPPSLKLKNVGVKYFNQAFNPQMKVVVPPQEKPILPSVSIAGNMIPPDDKARKDPRKFQSSEKMIRNSILNNAKQVLIDPSK